MNEQLLNQLEDLGLSEKEARVYTASLMLGPATVQQIANQAGIKRVTAYVILESLANLGLVSQSTKGKKTFFIAEDPTTLEKLLDKKTQQLEEQRKSFEELLPDLKALKNIPADSPSVRFYDSKEGMETVIKYFIEANKKAKVAYGVTNLDQFREYFPEFKSKLHNPNRIQAGVSSKVIYTAEEGPILKSGDEQAFRESQYVPKEAFPLNGDIGIVGDAVIMFALTGTRPLGITIQSKELAATMRVLFDMAWQTAQRLNQEKK